MQALTAVWDWVDTRRIFRRCCVIWCLWMTWRITEWSMGFAEASTARTGIDIAAIIAAVGVPIAALQGLVVRDYFESRSPP